MAKPDYKVVLPPELGKVPARAMPRTLALAADLSPDEGWAAAAAGTPEGAEAPQPSGQSASAGRRTAPRRLFFLSPEERQRRGLPPEEEAEGEEEGHGAPAASSAANGPAAGAAELATRGGAATEAEGSLQASPVGSPAALSPLHLSPSVGSLLDPVTPHWATNSVISDLPPSEDATPLARGASFHGSPPGSLPSTARAAEGELATAERPPAPGSPTGSPDSLGPSPFRPAPR